jgi:dihydropteroate synthase
MGIVNVTPDSFSDGGQFAAPGPAIDHALQLVADGAAILDIGGESTRPYSQPVSVTEELQRVIPVIESVARRTDVPISIDTSKAEVAAAAVAAGAQIINDVTGLEGDPHMLAVALASGAGICAMHMQGTPQTMQDRPHYHDVVAEILAYLQARLQALLEAGVSRDRICLDPGIGFGKTHAHNLTLLRSIDRFHALGAPLLVGHSRKGFIANILGDKTIERDSGTLGISFHLALQGVQVIRVHQVALHARAWRLWQTLHAASEGP